MKCSSGGVLSIKGSSGADILKGGSDILISCNGNDLLIGNSGYDKLTGGKGVDKFRIIKSKAKQDTITDFKRSQKDKIQVVSKNFKKLSTGKLSADKFDSNKNGIAKDLDDYFVFKTKNKTLYFDKDGSGSAVAIAKIVNKVTETYRYCGGLALSTDQLGMAVWLSPFSKLQSLGFF